MLRRRVLALGVAWLAVACGSGAGGGAAGPIKLGLITPTSGAFAEIGSYSKNGAQVAVDEINRDGGVGGRKLELVVKDEQLSPTATVQDLRDLQSAGVNLVLGFASSDDCLAAAPVAQQLDMVLMGGCNDNSLTTTKFNKHFFQEANNLATLAAGTAGLVHDRYGSVKTWDVYSLDYVTGHDVVSLFKSDLAGAAAGAQLGKEVYAPLSAADVRSYVSSLESAVPAGGDHGLFDFTYGAASTALIKQGVPAGLFKRFAAVVNIAGSEPTAAAIGSQFPPNVWFVYDYYYQAYANPMNQRFVADYRKAYGGPPVAWSAQMHTMVYAFRDAIQKAGGTDSAKLIPALEGMRFDSVKGSLQFRASDHLLVQPATAFQCGGDATAPQGYRCSQWDVIAADRVTPPSNVS
jgi:branched-chain amino acid transport system substrate-binding protein